MKLLSVQVGKPRTVHFRGEDVTTGIFKDVVEGPVMARSTNLEGDGQADLQVHGGKDKAVYGYSFDTYAWWEAQRPRDQFPMGAMGENLTFEHLPEDRIFVGDTFELGGCVLEAAQPRFPCYKLGARFNDLSIVKQFMTLGRAGVYFRVLKEGLVKKGDELKLLSPHPARVSIDRVFWILIKKSAEPGEIENILKIDILPDEIRGKLLKLADPAR